MKRAQNPAITAAIPGAQGWELWRWATDGSGACVARQDTAGALKPPKNAILCVPASETTGVAIWLSTTDEAVIPEMAALQAEAIFHADREGNAFTYRVVRREETRTLIFGISVPTDTPTFQDVPLAAKCLPTFLGYEFEPEAITIFRELGAFVAIATSAEGVVGVLRLGTRSLEGATVMEIFCFALRLTAEKIVPAIRSVVVWDSPEDEAFELGLKAFGLTCRCLPRPSPRLPAAEMDLTPPSFHRALRRAERGRKLRLAGATVLAGVMVLLVVILVRYGWLELEYRQLEAANAEIRPEADRLRTAASNWKALEPAINPDLFAIEWLNQFASRIPEKGVRLTAFQMNPKGISVIGEADGAAQVVRYQDALAAAPSLASLHLAMPPPRMEADNLARFEITGALKGGTTDEVP